ncbi:MAG TPA: hypothetical protein VGC51_06440 [Hansschlegelia sp.]
MLLAEHDRPKPNAPVSHGRRLSVGEAGSGMVERASRDARIASGAPAGFVLYLGREFAGVSGVAGLVCSATAVMSSALFGRHLFTAPLSVREDG